MRTTSLGHVFVAVLVKHALAVYVTNPADGFHAVAGDESMNEAREEIVAKDIDMGVGGERVLQQEEDSEWEDFSQLVLRPTRFLLSNVSITTESTFLGAPLQLDLVNGECSYLTVDHVGAFRLTDDPDFVVRVVGDGLTVNCTMSYSYQWLRAGGDGPVEVSLRESEIWADIQLLQGDQMQTVSCDATGLEVQSVLFPNGGVAGAVNSFFRETVRSTVEVQVEDTLCVEIETYIQEDFSDALSDVSQLLANYTDQRNNSTWEQAETDFLQSTDVEQNLISFLGNSRGDDSTWLSYIIPWFLEIVEDSFTPANISAFLRTEVLTPEHAENTVTTNWILPVAMTDVVLYSLEDVLETNTSLRFESMQLQGLDLITASDFHVTSDYTLSAQLSFPKISIAADLAVDILQLGTNVTFLENLAVSLQLENVTTAAALLIALNEDNLNDLVLSSLWESATLLSCLIAPQDFTVVEAAEVSRLTLGEEMVVTRKPVPILVEVGSAPDSSDDLGIVEFLHNASNIAFDWYEERILQAAPALVSGPMRKRANIAIDEYLQTPPETCGPRGTGSSEIVNYWDFLLPAEEASSLGATGSMPYGDVPSLVFGALQDELSSFTSEDAGTCSTNQANLNTEYVTPISEALSGEPGSIVIGNLYEDWKPWDTTVKDVCAPPPSVPWWVDALDLDTLSMSLLDLQLTNVDTISSASILDLRTFPNADEFHNHIVWGCSTSEQPLGMKLRVSMNIGNAEETATTSPLTMQNTVDFNLQLAGLDATVGVLAKMKEAALMDFQIGQLPFVECWLATLAEFGLTNATNFQRINHDDFTSWDAVCAQCTSSGLHKLGVVFRSWSDSELTEVLTDGLLHIATDVVTSKWFQESIMEKEVRRPAAKQCARRQDRRNLATVERATESKTENDCEPPPLPPPPPSSTPPATQAPTKEKEKLVLTTESAEIVVLGAVVFVQALWVVISESVLNPTESVPIPTHTITPSDPLVQNGLSDTSSLVDFVNGSILEPFRSSMEAFLISNDTQTASSQMDIGANTLLNSTILDDQEAWSWTNVSIDVPFTEVSISTLRVFGLNTIQRDPELELFRPTGPQSLRALVNFEELRMEVDVLLRDDKTISDSTDGTEDDPITVSLGAKNVTVTLDMFLALNETILGDLPLYVLMRSNRLVACLASSLVATEVTQLVVTVNELMIPTAVGFSSPEREEVVARALQDVMTQFGEDLLTPAFPYLFSGRGLSMINKLLQYYVDEKLPTECNEEFAREEWEGKVDFRDLFLIPDEAKSLGGTGESPYGDLVPIAKSDISKELAALSPQSKERLDMLLSTMTKDQSGEEGTLRFFRGSAISQSREVELAGGDIVNFTVRVSNVRLENLGIDTIRPPIKVLDPMFQKVSELNSSLTVGLNSSQSLRFGGTFLIELDSANGLIVRDEVDMGLILEDAELAVELLAMVSEKLFLGLPLRDIFNPYCWIATIPAPILTSSGTRHSGADRTAGIVRLMSQVYNASFFVNCISCTSSKLEEFVDLLADPSNAADINRATTSLVSQLLDVGTGELLQVQVDRALNEAPYYCPHSVLYDEQFTGSTYEAISVSRGSETEESATTILIGVVVALAVVLAFVTGLTLFEYWIARRLHRAWLRSLSDEDLVGLRMRVSRQAAMDKIADTHSSSMAKSKDVPAFFRFGMPIIFMANSLLFASGHLMDGFSLDVSVNLGDKNVVNYTVLRYSILEAMVELFRRGGRSLAMVVFIASIIWPYMKLLLMTFLWFASPSRVSVRRRERTIRWVDFLGKWSMVDIIVVWIALAAFRVEVRSNNDYSFLPNNLYKIDAVVVPLWGLVAHLLAQIVSQISSQLFSYYHDRVVEVARVQEVPEAPIEQTEEGRDFADNPKSGDKDEEEKRKTALSSRVFVSDGIVFAVRPFVTPVLGILAVVTIISVVLGCVLPLFRVELLGVLSYLSRLGPDWSAEGAFVQYSVMNMAESLSGWGASDVLNRREMVASGVFGVVLVASVLVFPILEALALVILWFVPLSHVQRQRAIGAVHIFEDWQYLEVFLVAVVLTVWQMGAISGVAEQYCKDLEPMFSSLVYYGIMDSEDAQCFQLEGHLRFGTFWLVAGLGVLAILRHFVLPAAEQVVEKVDSTSGTKSASTGRELSAVSVQNSDPIASRRTSLSIEERGRAVQDIPLTFSDVRFTDAFRFALIKSS